MVTDAARLLENVERLREGVEMVRAGSQTARDQLATVLHVLVGGDGVTDGYGLLGRGLRELGLGDPEAESWGAPLPANVDGQPVMLALRGSPEAGQRGALLDHLSEECLRFDIPGIESSASWSYLDVVKKVRNKFASHVDRRPPRWLEELRFFPAGDADAVTFLLWRAAEVSLRRVSTFPRRIPSRITVS